MVAVAANYDVRGFWKYTAIDKSGKIVAIRVKENRSLSIITTVCCFIRMLPAINIVALDKKGNFVADRRPTGKYP